MAFVWNINKSIYISITERSEIRELVIAEKVLTLTYISDDLGLRKSDSNK